MSLELRKTAFECALADRVHTIGGLRVNGFMEDAQWLEQFTPEEMLEELKRLKAIKKKRK